MKKMNGKKIAALMTALVLALGVSIPASTALADEKTDSLRDAIYRTLKEKQKAQEEAPAEIVVPPVSTDSGAAQTEEQTEAQPEEAAAEEAAPEATSPYLRMKVTGAATLMDITAEAANTFTDAEVLAAFRIENADLSSTVTVALAQKPTMAEGDKLQLVGLNDWIINKRMVVGGLEIGQKVQFTVRMVDGFALILHRAEPAAEEAPEAAQPAEEVKPEAEVKSEVEEVKPEEPAQPEAEPEITADAVTTPLKADVAKQILKDLTAHTEEPAAAEAEQPETATEDTKVQNDEEAPADEPAEASEEQTEAVEENTEVQNNEEENEEEISEELNEELPEQPEAVVREEEELSEEPAEEEAEDEEISEESDEEEAGEEAPEVELEEKAAEETAGEAEEQIEAPIEETYNEAPVTHIEETMSEAHEAAADEPIEETEAPIEAPIDEPAEETESPIEAAVEETDEAVIEENAEEIPSNPEDLRKLAHKFSDLVILDDYNTPLGIEDFKKITMLDVTDVRIDPDGMSPIFLTLEKDEEVTLIGMEGDWAQIVVGEEIGYIWKDALEAQTEAAEAFAEDLAAGSAALVPQTVSAEMGDAVAILSGNLPEGVAMEVKLLTVSVANLNEEDTGIENLYAFELCLTNADGSEFVPEDGSLMMTVSGGKVADAIAENRFISVSTLPGKEAAKDLEVTLTKDSASFPLNGVAFRIDALPVSDTPVIPEPDPLNVTIESSMTGMVRLGDLITLTGVVGNADTEPLYYLWECDRGAGFEPVVEADGAQVSFAATAESMLWNWRLTVVVETARVPETNV